jgi:hypothetical protein
MQICYIIIQLAHATSAHVDRPHQQPSSTCLCVLIKLIINLSVLQFNPDILFKLDFYSYLLQRGPPIFLYLQNVLRTSILL